MWKDNVHAIIRIPFNCEEGVNMNSSYNNSGNNFYGPPITPRSIPLCVIFYLITCGIYGIYWMIKLNDEVNELVRDSDAPSGGIVFLLSLVTCGIYGLYWMYKMGERCDQIKGNSAGYSHILYLVLSLFGFSIISYCLIQDTINQTV